MSEEARPTNAAPQISLLDVAPDWAEDWGGMPEYVMGNAQPVQRITVNFASHEDAVAFGRLIGQRVTSKTDSLW